MFQKYQRLYGQAIYFSEFLFVSNDLEIAVYTDIFMAEIDVLSAEQLRRLFVFILMSL